LPLSGWFPSRFCVLGLFGLCGLCGFNMAPRGPNLGVRGFNINVRGINMGGCGYKGNFAICHAEFFVGRRGNSGCDLKVSIPLGPFFCSELVVNFVPFPWLALDGFTSTTRLNVFFAQQGR
jgi:hypothetical protein